MIEITIFKEMMEENKDRLPLLTLDDFFKEIQLKIQLPQINGSVVGRHFLKYGSY